jgi:hypothetical protein
MRNENGSGRELSVCAYLQAKHLGAGPSIDIKARISREKRQAFRDVNITFPRLSAAGGVNPVSTHTSRLLLQNVRGRVDGESEAKMLRTLTTFVLILCCLDLTRNIRSEAEILTSDPRLLLECSLPILVTVGFRHK